MSGFDYLLLPQLEVRHANAVSSYWALSPEVVLAARQMVHALARQLGVVEQEAGVALIHHHVEMLGEQLPKDQRFRPQQRRGAVYIDRHDYSDKNKHALSIQPTATMHLRITLIARFRGGTPLDLSEVRRFLRGGRLAGGQIVEHGDIEVLHRESAVWERLRAGHLVLERPDLLQPAEDDRDIIDPFFRALVQGEPENIPDDETEESREGDRRGTWLVPATLGYAAVTPVEPRRGAREGYPAAYAEPLVGLIQYQPLREARESGPLPFWDYSYPEPGVFVITHDNQRG